MVEPYLGSIGPFLKVLAGEHPRQLSFSRVDVDLGPASWRDEAHVALMEQLAFSPEEVPLDAETPGTQRCDGYVRATVEFPSTGHHRLRCELLIPEGDGLSPGMVALHDHSGFFTHGREKLVEGMSDDPALLKLVEQTCGGRFWASELARRGRAVIVNGVLGWGELRLPDEELQEPVRGEIAELEPGSREWARSINRSMQEIGKGIDHLASWAGFSWMGLVLWDDRKAFEYLLSRPETDGGRIACFLDHPDIAVIGAPAL